jgi:hypothetical protein
VIDGGSGGSGGSSSSSSSSSKVLEFVYVYLCCSFVVRLVVLCIDVLCVSVMDEVNKILLLWRWMLSLWQMSGVGTSGS